MFRSIRFRIAVLAAVVVTLVLAVAGVALLQVQRNELIDAVDRTLRARADAVVAVDTLPSPGDEPIVLANQAGDDVVVQFVIDGVVVASTENAAGIGPIGPTPSGDEQLRTVDALPVEDDAYRVLSRQLATDGSGGLDGTVAVVHVAESTDDLEEVLGQLRLAVLVTAAAAVAVLTALVWWLVGRTLRPVDAIRDEVASISAGDLSRRVPEPNTRDEIDRLAETMNSMLQRLEQSSERQRRFVADAAHELRSPLTRLRATAETGESLADVRSGVVDDVDAMTALVDGLLVLARADARRLDETGRPTDLDDIVVDEVRRFRERADHSPVAVDVSAVSAANVVGDAGQLRRMIRNLLDNATRHATSRVTVALTETGVDGRRVARLVVADDGEGIAAEDRERVFERFTRLDDARSRDDGGVGLGLAIVREIAVRHGGAVRIDGDRAAGARFVVEIPAG